MNGRPIAGSLFSGVGGMDLGLARAGFRHGFFCEIDPYRRKILNRHWPGVPVYEDVWDVDENAPQIDLLCGGFPCQPFSVAGKRRGRDDVRWLWPAFARVAAFLQPEWILIENVPGLLVDQTVKEPADRCLCGWPRRWRGDDLHRQEPLGEVRGPDDGAGASVAELFEGDLWWEGQAMPSRNGEVGGELPLDPVVRRGDSDARAANPVPVDQATPGGASGSSSGDQAARQADPLDGRATQGSNSDASRDVGVESEGAEDEDGPGFADRVVPAGDPDCPACGRRLGGRPDESVLRSGIRDVLRSLAHLGFHDVSWRILDSRYLGVPQRRRRVFILGRRASGGRARAVLLEPESGGGDFAPSSQARQGAASTFGESVAGTLGSGRKGGGRTNDLDNHGAYVESVAKPLGAKDPSQGGHRNDLDHDTYIVGETPDPDRGGAPSGNAGRMDDPLRAEPRAFMPYDPKPDGPRYAACGDAVTSSVAQWIGERLIRYGLEDG